MINQAQIEAVRRVQMLINIAAGNTYKTKTIIDEALVRIAQDAEYRSLLEKAAQVLGAVENLEGVANNWLTAVINDKDYPS